VILCRLFAGVDLAVMSCVVYHLHSDYSSEGRLRRGSLPRDRWQRFGSWMLRVMCHMNFLFFFFIKIHPPQPPKKRAHMKLLVYWSDLCLGQNTLGRGVCAPLFSFIRNSVGSDAPFIHIVGFMKPARIGWKYCAHVDQVSLTLHVHICCSSYRSARIFKLQKPECSRKYI
jgi:hypothetical protein